jgi:hypothetical protein
MIEHDGQDLETNANGSESSTILRQAWVEGSIGAVNITAGSWSETLAYGALMDYDVKGLKLNYATERLSIDLYAFRPYAFNYFYYCENVGTIVYTAQAGYNFSDKLHGLLAWHHAAVNDRSNWYTNLGAEKKNNNIFEIGLDYNITPKLNIRAEYIGTNKFHVNQFGGNIKNTGWAAGLSYDGKDLTKPGSFEMHAAYYSVPPAAAFAPTTELYLAGEGAIDGSFAQGYKGWNAGASYVLAKNVGLSLEYYNLRSQQKFSDGAGEKASLLWTYMTFYF